MKDFLFNGYTLPQERVFRQVREQLRQQEAIRQDAQVTRGRWQCYLSGCMILQNQMDEAVMIE